MGTSKVRAKVKRQREIRTFAELRHANWVLLENAKEPRPGCFYEWMVAILMAAFTFEAYLNHIGKAMFPYWDEMECLPNRNKLNIICARLDIKRSYGRRPYQTLKALFQFRNDIAHGKSESLNPPESIEVGHIEDLRRKQPLARWEQICTIEFARQAYEDTQAIIEGIHKAAGHDEAELCRAGHGWSIETLGPA